MTKEEWCRQAYVQGYNLGDYEDCLLANTGSDLTVVLWVAFGLLLLGVVTLYIEWMTRRRVV